MMSGPNFDDYQKLSQLTELNVIASGGVSSLEDITKLKKLGLYGAITGKALYERKFELKEAIICSQNE
jgi:phosphoribosylformimino-5-aminoimidazole carboxamide ribotide isomerase